MDELEWKGKAGAVFAVVDELRKELEELKKKRTAKAGTPKKDFEALGSRHEELVALVSTMADRQDNLSAMIKALQDDNNAIRVELGKTKTIAHEAGKKAGNCEVGIASINSAVGKTITGFEAKLLKVDDRLSELAGSFADILTEAQDEAKTAIHAEAQAAAVEAVGKLMGDG